MNTAYCHARLGAALPRGGLPETFAILSACGPSETRSSPAENEEQTRQFQAQLASLGLDHFPVTDFDLNSPHEEAGFGVVCDLATARAMGNSLLQNALSWVHRGHVTRIHLGSGDIPVPTEDQRQECRLSLAPDLPHFHFRGPFALLEKPATAFLCSTQCPGDKILEAYEWARHQCDIGGTVISGFHTPIEKDVLAILLRRGAYILWVPARDLPITTPKEFKPAVDEGRLTVLSPFDYGKVIRPTRESSSARNRFILSFTDSRFIPFIADTSSLAKDLEGFPS